MEKVAQIANRETQSKENYLKLLSIIAHNVKGPVQYMEFITDFTIRNWTTMKPEDLLDCATLINESARNISEQLGGLLSWARIQDGTFKPNVKSFTLSSAVEDELRIQRAILKLKSIQVKTAINQELSVNSDYDLLRLALHNILNNAINFTEKKGTITISAAIANKNAMLSIEDNGIGMKPEELALLYDDKSFSNPGTVNEQGTGFGLRIAKEIVEILNGSIEVDSQFGVGTTVTICLPV